MKIAARKNSSLDEQRRYRRQYDRDRSPALRSAFPQLLQLNIELSFGDRTGAAPKEVVPSSQSHAFYPPAQAFFRFRCPCADCDGEFDLTTNVAQLAATTGRGSRTVTAQVHCSGTRARSRQRQRLPDRTQLSHRRTGRTMNSWRTALPLAGEPTADFRERLARQQAEAAERRQTALTEQASPLNSAQARINIWEQLHAIELPRDAGHRLVALIAANTGL